MKHASSEGSNKSSMCSCKETTLTATKNIPSSHFAFCFRVGRKRREKGPREKKEHTHVLHSSPPNVVCTYTVATHVHIQQQQQQQQQQRYLT